MFELLAWNQGIGYFSSEIGPSTLFAAYTSWWHMFGWNIFGLLLMGPAVATMRFFDTLNRVESKLNLQIKVEPD
ncbi:MAG: hypothetical protein IK099_01525, partial [Clostridia bacterium]|nr:hypothetical protein [Clostridia bacterium]